MRRRATRPCCRRYRRTSSRPLYEVSSWRVNSMRKSPLTTRRNLATFKRIRGASCVGGVTLARSPLRPHRRPFWFISLNISRRGYFPFGVNVGENGPVAVSLQPLIDESPKHHLEAHRALELGCRSSGEDSSPVPGPLGENEKDPGLALEHRYLLLARLAASVRPPLRFLDI